MSAPYAIIVRDVHTGHESELCRVKTNPQAIAAGALRKTYRAKHTNRWWQLPMYDSVRIERVGDA